MTERNPILDVLRSAALDPAGGLADGLARDMEEHLLEILAPEMANPEVTPECLLVHDYLAADPRGAPSPVVTAHIEQHNPCLLCFHLPGGPPSTLLENLADDFREELATFSSRVAAKIRQV